MSLIENMPYKKSLIVKDDLFFEKEKRTISLTKSFCDNDDDRYYLKVNMNVDNQTLSQGYLYFYLNFDKMQSKFIGLETYKEYRNNGVASLLISTWIQFCLDEGFINLQTISKQGKPFIIFLLKKYFFELRNLNLYQTSNRVIYICKKENDSNKCILFEDKKEAERFSKTNIMRSDNYRIIDESEQDIEILDRVILNNPYLLNNSEAAYQKSLQISKKYKL